MKPGDRIGLLFDRSAETYIILLAVMKVGAAYVPLATAFPEDRTALIIDDAAVKLVISLRAYLARGEQMLVPHILIDACATEISQHSNARSDVATGAANLDEICYLLYTSGTTGRPKGVLIRHQSFCNCLRVAAVLYGYKPSDRVCHGMTIAFDFSAEESWVLCGSHHCNPRTTSVDSGGRRTGRFST